MHLVDQQLDWYVDEFLSFGQEDKRKYQAQIDFLIETITRTVSANTNLRVLKVNQAGSWRKGTALKPRDGFDIDIDLIVYLDVNEANRTDIATLHASIISLLRAAYPTKPPGDFKPGKKTVGIEFRTSGLKVDLVPVIPAASPPGFVWQPEVGGAGAFLSSPAGQLEFVRRHKDADPRYARVVRLAKRWRNVAELRDVLSSFTLELIAAHVGVAHGPAPSLEEGLVRLLAFIAGTGLRQPIAFQGAIRTCPVESAAVRIHDPTNNENNVTSRLSEADRLAIVEGASAALEAIVWAQSIAREGDTLERWKGVFGPSFKVEEAS